ncbi:predicted protein [Plenodomus lingam JN3]|uniref:Predicted protein n=1 Tax=Leptosphaeria maculans (strain JN3 / isolate v23.1.3 / race Av1-4-5-6-7-8) TaxID=985895 RepID=E5A587_LEPMJ|nr:predicted protein [Plenodomus lingam JN3]CBX98785.1 predicted protein [Plenodomus lingam JN3]
MYPSLTLGRMAFRQQRHPAFETASQHRHEVLLKCALAVAKRTRLGPSGLPPLPPFNEPRAPLVGGIRTIGCRQPQKKTHLQTSSRYQRDAFDNVPRRRTTSSETRRGRPSCVPPPSDVFGEAGGRRTGSE